MLNKNTEYIQTVITLLWCRREKRKRCSKCFKLFSCDYFVSSFVVLLKTISKLARLGEQMRNFRSVWPEHSQLIDHSEKVFLWAAKMYSKAWITHFYLSLVLNQQTGERWERNSWGIKGGEKHLHYLKMKSLAMLYRLLQGKGFYLT